MPGEGKGDITGFSVPASASSAGPGGEATSPSAGIAAMDDVVAAPTDALAVRAMPQP